MAGKSKAGELMRDIVVKPVRHTVPLESYYYTAECYLRQVRASAWCPSPVCLVSAHTGRRERPATHTSLSSRPRCTARRATRRSCLLSWARSAGALVWGTGTPVLR